MNEVLDGERKNMMIYYKCKISLFDKLTIVLRMNKLATQK